MITARITRTRYIYTVGTHVHTRYSNDWQTTLTAHSRDLRASFRSSEIKSSSVGLFNAAGLRRVPIFPRAAWRLSARFPMVHGFMLAGKVFEMHAGAPDAYHDPSITDVFEHVARIEKHTALPANNKEPQQYRVISYSMCNIFC